MNTENGVRIKNLSAAHLASAKQPDDPEAGWQDMPLPPIPPSEWPPDSTPPSPPSEEGSGGWGASEYRLALLIAIAIYAVMYITDILELFGSQYLIPIVISLVGAYWAVNKIRNSS